MTPDPRLDEGADRQHLASALGAHIVERELRQRTPDALALKGAVHLGVGEDDELVGELVLRKAREDPVEMPASSTGVLGAA